MTDEAVMEQFGMLVGIMEKMSGQIDSIEERMATKDDLQKLETRMDARMKSLEYGMRSLEDSAISKILTHDDIEMITDRAANKALAVVENTVLPRLDALADGYKLTCEKQHELELRVERLEEAG